MGIVASSILPPNFGYFAGGFDGSVVLSSIDKLNFNTDINSSSGKNLTSQIIALSGMANSGTAGYFGGGQDSKLNNLSSVEKLAFSTESVTSLKKVLSETRINHAGMANSGTAGYFAGTGGAGVTSSSIDKIAFSNDTSSALSSNLSTNNTQLAAAAGSLGI